MSSGDDFAKEQADVFDRLATDLKAVVRDPGTTLTPSDKQDLLLAGDDAAYASEELKSIFNKLPASAPTGDIFQLAAMLIEAAFTIGRFGGTSESARNFFQKERQSTLGQRPRKSPWKTWCCDEAVKIHAADPRLSSDDVAQSLCAVWPRSFKKIEHRTVADYIRKLRNNGALGKQQRLSVDKST